MYLLDKKIEVDDRTQMFEIWPIGDVHFGKVNTRVDRVKDIVRRIASRKNALWFGGGDLLECIKPDDAKRFTVFGLSDDYFRGSPKEIKSKLGDVVGMQLDWAAKTFGPIANKCLGLVIGNHETYIQKRYNQNVHGELCKRLGVPDLTYAAWLRLRFYRGKAGRSFSIFTQHGCHHGRSEAGERSKLGQLRTDWVRADVVLQGNSHQYSIAEPKTDLYVPSRGKMPKEMLEANRWAANWGCWQKSHMVGPSPYEEEKCFPARPGYTVRVLITPFKGANGEIDIVKEKL